MTTELAALQLTILRHRAGDWDGNVNTVVHDFDRANVVNTLYSQLKADNYHVRPDGTWLVPLPALNYYIVNLRTGASALGGGQCSMLVNPQTLRAFHMVFH